MASHGQILNFRQYRIDQLIDMADRLQIHLSFSSLKKCELHYRKIEKRDPYIEELRLFDALQKSNRQNFAISEFLTEDSTLSKSYKDLSAKLKALYPKAKTPWHISDMAGAVCKFLNRAGAKKMHNSFPLFDFDPDSGMPVDFLHFPKGSPEECGDYLILVDHPESTFSVVKSFLDFPLSGAVKNGISCTSSGILQDILSFCSAVHLNVAKFGDVETRSFADLLMTSQFGKVLFRIAPESYENITHFFQEKDCIVSLIGIVPKDQKISLFVDRDTTFSVDADFVRSFTGGYERIISIPSSDSAKDASLEAIYQRRENGEIVFKAVTDNRDVKAGVSTQYLAAVTALALSGVHTWEMEVFPFFGADTPERITEALLTSYRFQAELSLSGTPVFLPKQSKNAILFAAAKGNGVPPRNLCGENTYLYFLDFTDFEQSDFPALRNHLNSIASYSQNGSLLSSVLFHHDSLSKKIEVLCGNSVSFQPAEGVKLFGRKISLGLLLESSRPLSLPLIGKLRKPLL